MPENGVSTGCDPLDGLLGGGLERGAVTQVYGPPASGKTNIALCAAVSVAADDRSAVYIDAEGISTDRLRQLAAAQGDVEEITSRIVLRGVHDFTEQREAVREAGDFADRADLIVLDSITGFYRLERTEDGDGEALRAVTRQLTSLLGLARKHDLAVLTTNQVYTDPDTDRIKPLGGHTLTHWTGCVLRLERFRGGNRRATLEKHRSKSVGDDIRFQITDTGLQAVESTDY